MSSVANRLARLIDGVPAGGAVTLPREAVERWLQEAGVDPDQATAGNRADVADLTVPELAEALDLSESTVRGWMPGVEGAYKLGGAWRVSRGDWRAYLDSLADEDDDETPEVRSAPSADLGDWRDRKGRGTG